MQFFCPGCGTRQEKSDDEIPAEGLRVPCEKCGFEIDLKLPVRSGEGGQEKSSADDREATVAKNGSDGDETIELQHAMGREGDENSGEEESVGPGSGKKPRTRKPIYLGTGRSGERYRFRDLLTALQIPLDPRKPLLVGLFVFAGNLLFAGLGYLGALTRSSVGLTVGLVLGGLLFWAACVLALGVTSQLTNLEMEAGRRVPLSEGVRFVLSRPIAVLGAPFVFFGAILVLGAALAVISLIGRIPYAGPIFYGLVFLGTFCLALAAVVAAVLMGLVSFSYVPAMAEENLGSLACVKRMLGMLRRDPGAYLLHALVAGLCALVLFLLLQVLLSLSLALIGWLGGNIMGPDFSATLIAAPGGLFGLAFFVLPDAVVAWLHSSAGNGWWYSLGGWLFGLSLLAVVSVVLAFVLTYFYGAGVVNYRLLLQKATAQQGRRD